jgi:hypothetical protein
METLKEQVEKTIRKFYGFGSNIAIKNVEVQFGVATQANGALPVAQGPNFPITKRKYKKRAPSKVLNREYSTSQEDIAVMRHFFSMWRKEGDILTPEMEHFLSQMSGVRYPMLSQESKSKMREYFEECRIKKLHARGGRHNELV